jgi:hypothetical protein
VLDKEQAMSEHEAELDRLRGEYKDAFAVASKRIAELEAEVERWRQRYDDVEEQLRSAAAQGIAESETHEAWPRFEVTEHEWDRAGYDSRTPADRALLGELNNVLRERKRAPVSDVPTPSEAAHFAAQHAVIDRMDALASKLNAALESTPPVVKPGEALVRAEALEALWVFVKGVSALRGPMRMGCSIERLCDEADRALDARSKP